MHKIEISPSIVARNKARYGKEHIFENFDPTKTALVVVDMQNCFMMPGVAHALCTTAQEIVPTINRLAREVRGHGGTVIWVKGVYRDETLSSWSISYEMAGPKGTAKRIEAMTQNSTGYQLWPDLEVMPEDLHVDKTRYSAFIQGSSDLERVLRSRGLDTLVVAGTVTNVCCESTARDAMMLNFRTIMVTDANAAITDEEHNAALNGFYLVFGDVMSTDEVIERLEVNSRKGLVAAE